MILAVALLGYLLGSIPWGFVIGRWRHGVDLRNHGSGNIGLTNALRVLGWKASVLVLVGDFAKGAVPVLLARWLVGTPAGEVVAGLAAIAGHDFSLFLRFRGGRGVTTSIAALAMFLPLVAGLSFGAFLLVVALTRYVSLGSLLGSGLALALVLTYYLQGSAPLPYVVFVAIGVPLIWFQHRDNIVRLVRGRERRLGKPAGAVAR